MSGSKPTARSRSFPRARDVLRRAVWIVLLLTAGLLAYDFSSEPPAPDYSVVKRTAAIDTWIDPAPPPTVEPGTCEGLPRRWIVVGWDGASWDLVLPLVEQGRLPHLAALMRGGVSAGLDGFKPSLSPVLWTTVATGVSPEKHKILGFDKRRHQLLRRLERIVRLGGLRRELFTNADRRAPALWNLATDAGLRSLVVGYHNTYPAEKIRGAMISNYLVQAYVKEIMRANRELPEAFRDSLVFPPESTEEVLELERRVEMELSDAIGDFANFDEQSRARFDGNSRSLVDAADPRMYFLRQAWHWDTFNGEATMAMHAQLRPDLTMVHFQGVDLISHYFLVFNQPDAYAKMDWPPDAIENLKRQRALYADTLPAFYAHLDAWLGRLLQLRDESTGVLVISDHGVEPEDDPERGGQHESAPPGIFVASGPGIRSGTRIEHPSLYDILPTLARALGLPLARDLPGRVIEEMFCPGVLDEIEFHEVDAYAPSDWAPSIAPPPAVVDEIERQLKSLGYVD